MCDIAPLKAELLKHLESNEVDSDVLKEIQLVLLKDLSDRYSDHDTLHTSKPRLDIFAMNEFHSAILYLEFRSGCMHIRSSIILFSF